MNKQWLQETWPARAQLFFIANGIKRIIHNNKMLLGSLIYWAVVLIWRWFIVKDNASLKCFDSMKNTGNA